MARRRSSTCPCPSMSQKWAPCLTGRAFLAVLRGSSAALPARRATQGALHGQSTQAGVRVQIVAPRSNNACAKSDGLAWAAGASPRRAAAAAIAGLLAGQRRLDAEQPRGHAFHVPIHRNHWDTEGDGGHCCVRPCRRLSLAVPAAHRPVEGKTPPRLTTAFAHAWQVACPVRNNRGRPRRTSQASSPASASACTVGNSRKKRS